MGTRAQFFIGDPSDLENREWLGCIAWDGYPDEDMAEFFLNVDDEAKFQTAVKEIKADRDDFTDPSDSGFPFPWVNDLYLTDYTYAFFDGKLQITCFHSGWMPAEFFFDDGDIKSEDAEKYFDEDRLPNNVPAPAEWDTVNGKDSIMIIGG